MAKLIDAMRIDFDEVDISGCTDVDDIIAAVEDLIDAQPAVDAVEVVRCKDCMLCYESISSSTGYKCSVWGLYGDDCECSPEGFCNKAMRRADNGNTL